MKIALGSVNKFFETPGSLKGPDMSKRNFLKNAAGAAVIATVAITQPALAAGISADTQKKVAAFLKAHPEMVGEFMPFEQDCIDGKKIDPQCESNVTGQLADLQNEVRVNAKEAQVDAKEAQVDAKRAQVDAKRAQVNAERAQVNAESDMVNRATIVTVVLQLNNAIQYGNPDRSGIVSLDRIKNPILQNDISFMRSIDTKLAQKKSITHQETAALQAILINQSGEVLRIYSSFTPAQQQRFIDTKTIAVGAQKYALK